MAPSANVILYNKFKELYTNNRPISDVFENKNSIIVLLQIEGPNAPSVGHWIAILRRGADEYEHFDSYGLNLDEELHITHEKPYLTALLTSKGVKVSYNKYKLQLRKDDMNTCGRWCVARVRLHDLTLEKFAESFMKTKPYDHSVALATMFL